MRPMQIIPAVAALAAAILLTSGCGSDKPTPRTATDVPTSNARITSAEAPRAQRPTPSHVVISPDIRAICRIEEVASAPKFDFDESEVTVDDRGALEKLAECLTTGPLAGQTVKLTGRADPRGEEEYNMALGSRRASSVGDYLEALGVPTGHLLETSRGELDAQGTDESTWAIDRRVDITRAK